MSSLAVTERKLTKLNAEKIKLENAISKIIKERFSAVRNSLICCTLCNKKSRLSAWTFIQRWWWLSATGCDDGAYWKRHKTETCYIVCPKCGGEIYLYHHPKRDRIVKLIDESHFPVGLFHKVQERYDAH